MSLDQDNESHIKSRMTHVICNHTGFKEPLAGVLASEIFDAMCHDLRGERMYFARSTQSRDSAVLADIKKQLDGHFDQNKRRAICCRHGISESTFYRILDRRRGSDRRSKKEQSR